MLKDTLKHSCNVCETVITVIYLSLTLTVGGLCTPTPGNICLWWGILFSRCSSVCACGRTSFRMFAKFVFSSIPLRSNKFYLNHIWVALRFLTDSTKTQLSMETDISNWFIMGKYWDGCSTFIFDSVFFFILVGNDDNY